MKLTWARNTPGRAQVNFTRARVKLKRTLVERVRAPRTCVFGMGGLRISQEQRDVTNKTCKHMLHTAQRKTVLGSVLWPFFLLCLLLCLLLGLLRCIVNLLGLLFSLLDRILGVLLSQLFGELTQGHLG